MKEEFKHHLLHDLQVPLHSRILVAVSGGMDSIVLLDLLKNIHAIIGVAHANFQLRGIESDRDALFVKSLAEHHQLPFFSKVFETQDFADLNSISVQMAARQLRYEWFEELADTEKWDFIATAHHMDDQIETFFINLLRGTGIGGLKGIPAKSGKIIRPLLPFYKSGIEEYIRNNRLDYREDASNFKSDYLRNRIRHKLIPLLDELQPAFRKTMAGNIVHLTSAESFYREKINDLIPSVVKTVEKEIHITIPELLVSGHTELLLHEVLQPLGFTTSQTRQILQSLNAPPGKVFYSQTHRLLKDRNMIILQTLADIEGFDDEYEIFKDSAEILSPLHLQLETLPKNLDFHPVADPNKAFLDLDSIQFPMKIRKWKQGDRFKPFGMKGHVKLSDFYIANKFSIAEKEKTWLLTDARDQIIWIISHRIADNYRIRPTTKFVLSVTLLH